MQTPSRRALVAAAATALVVSSLTVLAQAPARSAQPGDIGRFDTWVGYDVGRYPELAELGDLDGDGTLDVVWGTDSWFPGAISVSLNLGDGSLLPAVPYPAGDNVADVKIADLDGDGDRDVVAVTQTHHTSGESVDVYLNDGSGALTRSSLAVGNDPESLQVADLDGDGDQDLVFTNAGIDDDDLPEISGIGVLLNDGDATFGPEVRYEVGRRSWALELADVDEDGLLDAVVQNHDFEMSPTDYLSVLTGNGDGTFDLDPEPQPLTTVGSWGQGSLGLGDLDGDDHLDLVVSGTSSGGPGVLLGDGTGEFGTATTYPSFGAVSLRVVDADDDGDLDVLGVGGGGGTEGHFTIQRNNGDGTLAAAEIGATSNNPLGLAVGDLDGDERVDLAIANRDTGTGATHLQRSDGSFAAPPAGDVFQDATDVAAGDLDGDGDVDLATTSKEGFKEVVRVFLNDGSGALAANGFVRWEDTLSRQSRGLRIADLDGDGDGDLTWIVNQYSGQRVVQAMNDGDATFATPTARSIVTCTSTMDVADVDGDGDLDEVFANETGCGASQDEYLDVSVSYNDGTGTFGNDIRVRMVWRPTAVAAFDANGDGHVDLVAGGVENMIEGERTGDVAVSLGDGTGAFPPGEWIFSGNAHQEFGVIDFEDDGDLDVAANSYADGTTLLVNDGAGGFEATTLPGEYVHGYTNAVGIAVGDVSGDSIPDVVIAHVTGSDVGVHTGNGDGTFEPRQVRYGISPRVWDVELADLDGDGLLDVISPSTAGGFVDGVQPAGQTSSAASGVLVLTNRRAECTITGTPGDDTLKGTRRTDVICGLGGNDTITGKGGGDILRGGPGHDTLRGGTGVDLLDGETGDDKLKGEDGDDRLRGGTGKDTLRGGKGRDVLDLLDGTKGNDTGNAGGTGNHCRADKKDVLQRC